MAGSYKELRAWKQAVDLALEVYRLTEGFPRSELYGLTTQIRRSAVSVPSNIAEGKGRFSDREFALFLRHARGSLLELETQLFASQFLQLVFRFGKQPGFRVHEHAAFDETFAPFRVAAA